MQQSPKLVGLIQDRIAGFIADQHAQLTDLGSDVDPLIREIESYLTGGKRLRAQFLVLGYRSVRELEFNASTLNDEASAVLDAACALELFHAAALIHDDIIDRSDTRRGRASTHKVFERFHTQSELRGDADRFGQATALLLGDLLQSWADELFQHALRTLQRLELGDGTRAREHFNRMRTEVALGQYLDVLEEQRATFAEAAVQLERSMRVLIYKSAKYSVQAPLLIGCAMAAADEEQEQALEEFGLPVGVAFQLRDDILGVFGDEALTGKPTGGDLTEGKRTVLVTLTRSKLPSGPLRVFDDLHGTPDLAPEQIEMLQRTIIDTGTLRRVEEIIAQNIGVAREKVREAPLTPRAARELIALAEYAGERQS